MFRGVDKLINPNDSPGKMSLIDQRKSNYDMISLSQETTDFNDNIKNIKSFTSTIGETSLNEPNNLNIVKLRNIIEKEAFKFRDKFIGSKSLYEINIPNSINTEIIKTLRIVPGDLSKSTEEKIEIYYKIFDKACKEVLDNIYLNSYSNYIHQKGKESNN